MKAFSQHETNRTMAARQRRRGISLFEVLISILVASIGVFGVLVLIPFAVKNAQIGIDRESSVNAAKNFYADFQAYGYDNPDNWVDGVDDDSDMDEHDNDGITFGVPYLIDPIEYDERINRSPSDPPGVFPELGNGFDFESNQISRITLADSSGNSLSKALAKRLMLQPDDLLFDDPADELGPPSQRFFQIDGSDGVKRQNLGRYATIAFVIPLDNDGIQYRMYTLIGKAGTRESVRVFTAKPSTVGTGDIEKEDTGPVGRQFENIAIGGGDFRLTEEEFGMPPQSTHPEKDSQIRNNDTFILINRYKPVSEGTTPDFDDVQMNFYKVIHASEDESIAATDPAEYQVTLQGPDFDLFRDWALREDGMTVPSVGDATDHTTYAILIPNVLAVYERTIRVEPDSAWFE